MNLKTTVILFGTLLGILFIFALTQFLGTRPPGEGEEWAFPELHEKKKEFKSSDMKSVRIQRKRDDKAETLVFERGKQGWEMIEPYKLRVENYTVDSMVDNLVKVKREKSEMSSSASEYGLTDPNVAITLGDGEHEWKLNLGKQSPGTANQVVYAVNPAHPKELMAIKKQGSVDGVYRPVVEFRAHDLLTANLTNAQAIDLEGTKDQVVALQKKSDGQWRFTKPDYGLAEQQGEAAVGAAALKPMKLNGVQQLVDALNSLRVETDKDFVADGVSEEELASKYGLSKEKPQTLRIQVKRTPPLAPKLDDEKDEPITESLLIGNKVPAPKEEKKDDKKPDDKKPEDKKADDKKGDEKKQDEKKPEEKPEYYYARMASENSVIQIPAKKIEPFLELLKAPDELRDRTLVRVPTGGAIDAIDIKNNYGLIKLRLADSSGPVKRWELFRDKQKGLETDESAVTGLVRELTAPHLIKTFPGPMSKLAEWELDKPTAVVSLWIDGQNRPEKKTDEKKGESKDDKKDAAKDKKPDDEKEPATEDKKPPESEPSLKSDKPTVRVSFGKVDRDQGVVYALREIGDEKTIITLPANLLDSATRGPLAYFNHKIPGFGEDPSEVLKELVVTRGGTTFKLEATKKDNQDVWKYKEPKDMQGRTASAFSITSMLNNLKLMRALRLAAENVLESDLEPLYGLKNPEVEIHLLTTGKDNKPAEYVYSFGKETADKTGVFARSNKSNLVYVVNKATVDLLKADFRDPTVLSFEPADVRKIKLTGWKGNLLKPSVVELERKEGTWKADFNLDPMRAEEFLNLLKKLQAVRFMPPQEAVKVDRNKFKPEMDGLLIEITLDKEKEPLTLYIDGVDAEDKNFYATNRPADGDLFLLPKDKFTEVKAGPKYFEKK
jgi:hypothetical protein